MLAVSGAISFGQASAGRSESGAAPPAVPAARQADNVAIITLHGVIDRTTSWSVRRRIDKAIAGGADAIVIELNTPGGEIGAAFEITEAVKNSAVPNTVAWVNPQAISAGMFVAVACREIVTADPAQMGDALPIGMAPGGIPISLPDDFRKKMLPPVLADVTESARRNGYDEFLVQAMVIDGVELWLVRDTATGRLLAVDEEEYMTLFGDEPDRLGRDGGPPRGRPLLAGATGTVGRLFEGGPPILPGLQEPPGGNPPNFPAPPGDDAAAPSPLAGVDESIGFDPANPRLADLGEQVTQGLSVPTLRPAITRADRGRYEPVGYLTDGSGPVVMGADQMLALGFATTKVETDEQLRVYFGARNLARLDETWSEGLVRFLTSFWVRGLLIVVFLIAAFVELASPGIGVAGVLAGAAGLLLLAPPALIGLAGWWEIVAIAAGVLLLLVEGFVLPGFGVFGVAGLLSLFLGLLGTFVPAGAGLFPDTPKAQSDALFGVVTILLSTFAAGVAIFFIAKNFGSLPLLNRLVLASGEASDAVAETDAGDLAALVAVGDAGVTLTPLRPAGRAEFGGAVLDVISDAGWIDPGTPVRVSSVSAFRTGVVPDDGAAPEPPATGEEIA